MEDAVFKKQSVSAIMAMKEKENKDLEAVKIANSVRSAFDQLHSTIV